MQASGNYAAITGRTDDSIRLRAKLHFTTCIQRGVHRCVAFLPGIKTSFLNGGLQLTPVYFLLNGSGAVIFFFLLSGFVLTQGFFRNPAPESLLRSVVKRLPRLMLPVSVTIIAGYLILKSGWAPYQLAAGISGSQWLHDFGNAKFPQGFTPTLASAVQQFLYVFLFSNNSFYNSNLWTMRDEFLGSLLVFAISALFLYRRFRPAPVMIPIHLGLIVASFFLHIAFVPFLVGSGLAYLIVVQNLTRLEQSSENMSGTLGSKSLIVLRWILSDEKV